MWIVLNQQLAKRLKISWTANEINGKKGSSASFSACGNINKNNPSLRKNFYKKI